MLGGVRTTGGHQVQRLVAEDLGGDFEQVPGVAADIQRRLARAGAQVVAGDRVGDFLERGHDIAAAMGEHGVQMHRRARTRHLAGDDAGHVATLE